MTCKVEQENIELKIENERLKKKIDELIANIREKLTGEIPTKPPPT